MFHKDPLILLVSLIKDYKFYIIFWNILAPYYVANSHLPQLVQP